MAGDSRFGADMYDADMATEPKNKGAGCLKGCLIVSVVLLVLAAIAAFLVYKYWPNLMAQALNQGIDESNLPAQEKVEVKEQVNRVAEEYAEGRLSFRQLIALIESLSKSPLMTSIVVSVVEEIYLDRSGLADEEKIDARQIVRRFVRGMVDGKIPENSIDAAMQHVADRQGDEWKLRDQVSDEDLRAFLAAAKASADEAEIFAEPEEFDPSDEVKKLIDEALAGG